MPRRRFTQEQRDNMLQAKIKQKRDCSQNNHRWYPCYEWLEKGRNIDPKYWTTKERFPMPIWDGKTLICAARHCRNRGQMINLSSRKQKKIQDIFNGFVENVIALRKDEEEPVSKE